MEMLQEYVPWIIVIVGGVLVVLKFVYNVKKNGLRTTAINLIVEAEKAFGSKKGQEKMEYVVNAIKSLIPYPFNLLITTDAVRSFCQSIFDEIKDALDYHA